MPKVAAKETIGDPCVCSSCGKPGRKRIPPVPNWTEPKNWACSVSCSECIMAEPGWTSIGWMKA